MKKISFTLIEVLVAITILGVLASIGVVSYTQYMKQTRVAKRKADLQQMRLALELYRNDHDGNYPTGDATGNWRDSCSLADSGSDGYIPGLAPNYMPRLPHDPREGIANIGLSEYCVDDWVCYTYKSDGADYKLKSICGAEFPDPYPSGDVFYDDATPIDLQISTKNATSWGW